jgi:broad specificity phosphatase PhoE
LNSEGRRQAHAVAAAVRAFIGDVPSRIVTSSLQRAVETGAAIAGQLSVRAHVDADWDEQSFGNWEGKTVGDLAASHPQELRSFREDPQYSRPGGEAHVVVEGRDGSGNLSGGTLVVVSHRKPIVTVLSHVLGIPHLRIWDGHGAGVPDGHRGRGRWRRVGGLRQRHQPPALRQVHPTGHAKRPEQSFRCGRLWNPCPMDERVASWVEQG